MGESITNKEVKREREEKWRTRKRREIRTRVIKERKNDI